jgi:hypothetical protein
VAKEYDDLIKKINAAVKSERNLRTALTTTLAIHKPRIFVQGFDAKGAKIGRYSTTPISISKKRQARNTGKTYFKGGYAEYHSSIGKGGTDVILRNTDQMFMDYGIQGVGLNLGFGFQNSENYNKSQWMQEKYQKGIFDLSKYEIDQLTKVLTDLLIKDLQ